MSPQLKRPPGDSHVSLAENPERARKGGVPALLFINSETQTKEEHAAVEKGAAAGGKRQSQKASLTLPKKGGRWTLWYSSCDPYHPH